MGNFRRDNNRFGGRRSGGGGGGFSGRDSGRPTMHRATCSECGDSCEVPFKPTGDKPIFCSQCFKGKGKTDQPRAFGGGRDSRRFDSGDKKMYSAVCSKCGNNCEVPFRPTGDKPVFCSQCFGKDKDKDSGRSPDQSNKQLEMINSKLDKILNMLNLSAPRKPEEKKEEAKKIEKTKTKKAETKVKKTAPAKKAKTKNKK